MRSVLFYSAARVGIFAVTAGLLWLVLPLDYGKSGGVLILLALAVFISGIVSYVLLARQREAMSSSVVGGVKKLKDGRTREDV